MAGRDCFTNVMLSQRIEAFINFYVTTGNNTFTITLTQDFREGIVLT